MNRANAKDTREILVNAPSIEQIDITSITQEDRDRLLVTLAIQSGAINQRCFRCPLHDTTINEEERAEAMLSMYEKVYDKKTNTWVKV